MNKSDLIAAVAARLNIPKTQAATMTSAVFDTLAETLRNGDKVLISDFGAFSVSERKAFTGNNPKTGKPLAVPAVRVPTFRAGKGLKQSLNT